MGGGPDGVEIVFTDMDHDVDQWRTASTELSTARTSAQGAVDGHPAFGVYGTVVGDRYLALARAVTGFIGGGVTATGKIADLIEANVAETTSRDDSADGRVGAAGGGGGPSGGRPPTGGGLPPGGGTQPGGSGQGSDVVLEPAQPEDRTPLYLRDTDGDGRPDLLEDEDHDGRLDVLEPGRDGTPRIWRDRDHDGTPDVLADLDGDGVADLLQDTDGDGTADVLEDDDGDGRPDVWQDLRGAPRSVDDADGDGTPDAWEDADGNGIVDVLDDPPPGVAPAAVATAAPVRPEEWAPAGPRRTDGEEWS